MFDAFDNFFIIFLKNEVNKFSFSDHIDPKNIKLVMRLQFRFNYLESNVFFVSKVQNLMI